MTTDALIDGILAREGGYVDDPGDRGGATNYGITAKTLGLYRGLGRQATRAEVQALTADEAKAIYAKQYVAPFLAVAYDDVRAVLVDICVMSGQAAAVRALQEAIGVPVDGILGARTLKTVALLPPRLTVAALTARRVGSYVSIVAADRSQTAFFFGWCRRATEFLT